MKSPIAILKESFQIYFTRENLDYFVKVGLVGLAINVFSLIPNYMEMFGVSTTEKEIEAILSNPPMLVFTIVVTIIVTILAIWSQASNYESVKRVISNEELSFKSTFKTSWKYLLKYFLVGLIVTFIILGGFLLLIIPAFIFGTFYMFAQYALVSGKGIGESLKYSKSLVKGRFWKVFGTTLVFGIFSFIIGIIFALVPYSLGSLVIALFSGLFILPYFIFYKELENNPVEN